MDNDHASLLTTITQPTEGATLVGTVTISATAANPSKVSRVQLYAGTRLLAVDYSSPYTFNWNTVAEADGAYTLTTRAYDSAGNAEPSAPVNVTVAHDTTSLTVTIASPTADSTVQGTVSVEANASDDTQVSRVELYVDGTRVSTSSVGPGFTTGWNSRNSANGPHTLMLRVFDSSGNVGNSPEVVVTVSNDISPPTVALTSPAPGASVAGMVSLQANASDDKGVTRVEFFVNSTRIATVTSPPYVTSWDSHTVLNGNHHLTAKAYDAVGNVTTSALLSVNVAQPGAAVYDSARKVPVCAQVSIVCDSTALLQGRGYAVGPELHYPNTLDGCTDGTASFGVEQIHWLRVSRSDGTTLRDSPVGALRLSLGRRCLFRLVQRKGAAWPLHRPGAQLGRPPSAALLGPTAPALAFNRPPIFLMLLSYAWRPSSASFAYHRCGVIFWMEGVRKRAGGPWRPWSAPGDRAAAR